MTPHLFATAWLLLVEAHAVAAPLEFKAESRFGKRISRDLGSTNQPSGVAVDPNSGTAYVTDLLFNRIQAFDAGGQPLREIRSKALGIAVDPQDGALWAALNLNHQVVKYGPDGKELLTIGSGKPGSLNGEFNQPNDVSVDPATGELYVTDTNNRRVQVFSRDGKFQRAFNIGFTRVFTLAVHPKGEWVVVVDWESRPPDLPLA